jgi:hypothetical protein
MSLKRTVDDMSIEDTENDYRASTFENFLKFSECMVIEGIIIDINVLKTKPLYGWRLQKNGKKYILNNEEYEKWDDIIKTILVQFSILKNRPIIKAFLSNLAYGEEYVSKSKLDLLKFLKIDVENPIAKWELLKQKYPAYTNYVYSITTKEDYPEKIPIDVWISAYSTKGPRSWNIISPVSDVVFLKQLEDRDFEEEKADYKEGFTKPLRKRGIKKNPPSHLRLPIALDEDDERLFNLEHGFGLEN